MNLEPATLVFKKMDLSGDLQSALRSAWGEEEGILLAHLWDGVLWGILREGSLLLPDAGVVPLRSETLIDLRIFNELKELRVWRSGERLRAVQVEEAALPGWLDFEHTMDRKYLLIGSERTPAGPDFSWREGVGGHRHCAPSGCERLRVRHYFKADPETGLLRESEHRWMGLLKGGER